MRGFLVSLGVHAAGVSALLALPVFSTSELPAVPNHTALTVPRMPTTVSIARPPVVATNPRGPRGRTATTASREAATAAPRTISEAPLDDRKTDGVLEAEGDAPWNGTETGGDGPVVPGLPPGPGGGGVAEVPRLVRAHVEVQAPRRIGGPQPVYPPLAIQTRQRGTVILECTIDPRGRVTDIRVLRGHPLFEAAAVQAVERWSYTPTLLNGVPVAVLMTVTVDFHLR